MQLVASPASSQTVAVFVDVTVPVVVFLVEVSVVVVGVDVVMETVAVVVAVLLGDAASLVWQIPHTSGHSSR
jgi:hypothetical protein